MSNCPKCGTGAPFGANFCANCGSPLHQGDTTTTMPVVMEDISPELNADQIEDIARLAPGTALLIVLRGPQTGAQFLIDRDLVVVGRHPKSDIFLDDVTVSRRHAEFKRHSGNIWISDAGSLNGTYVNRDLIDGEVALRRGDEVQVGKFRMVYYPGPA